MVRLLFISDYSEQFSYRLLKGISTCSIHGEKWVVCRMPQSHMRKVGAESVLDWAVKWKADAVIGLFHNENEISLFREKGIAVIAQDYISTFKNVPNVTADYLLTGKMAAENFITKGYRNFAYFGYPGVYWSEKRFEGFKEAVDKAGFGENLYLYDKQDLNNIWYYNAAELQQWLNDLPKPVAIMACDDNQGNLLLNVCNSFRIKIPYDVAVIGVDNDEVIDNLSDPTLSSIEVDIEQGGYRIASMIEKMVKDPSYYGEDIVLKPISVIERMSSSIFATKDKNIVKVLQYVNSNIDKPISVPDVLKEVPLSRRLLETKFKNATGSTLYSYISHQRIERFAHLLLLESKCTISEIAAQLHETDPNSLCRRFKMLKGCSPLEYRKREANI